VRIEQPLLDALDALGIEWSSVDHEPVMTVANSAQLHAAIPGAHSKNLFLKDAGGRFWLVTAPHDARIDLKALPGVIGARKLSFGKPDDMQRLLGVTPGSVTPLAAMNDRDGAVTVVIDAALAAAGRVNVHPLRNSATIGLSGSDLVKFLGQQGHSPHIVDVQAS
jgi:Ala-tRNA(Pro) deacylase